MTALAGLQGDFQAYLLGASDAAIGKVVNAGGLSAEERLGVYADGYRLRLLEALENDYIALHAHLGDDDFRTLGTAYIEARPSRHYSLRYFGQHMAAFLSETLPYAKTPLLSELAAFDWALTTAFDAPDEPVLTLEDMSAVDANDWPSLRFRTHASVLRLDLRWNAPAMWAAADTGTELPSPVQAEYPQSWVIWRQGLDTFFRSLAVDEAWALDAVGRGERFDRLCEGLCEWVDADHAAARAAGFLQQWIADGMLREFSI